MTFILYITLTIFLPEKRTGMLYLETSRAFDVSQHAGHTIRDYLSNYPCIGQRETIYKAGKSYHVR